MSASDDLKAMQEPFKNPKFIFFTDFDGTITRKDSNDYMTDNLGFGSEKRKQLGQDILDGKVTFRDAFREELDSVKQPFSECIDILVRDIDLDPHFNEYFQWSLKNNIPTVILSGGMTPIIKALLKHLIGPDSEKLQIVSNEVEARPGKSIDEEGGWQVKYHDESDFGHDKSRAIRPYAKLPSNERPTLFYAGDGVSDLSAASETDLLFAKKGQDLIKYCVREDVPFTVFEDWSSILSTVKKIVAGELTAQDAAKEGHELYKKGEAGI